MDRRSFMLSAAGLPLLLAPGSAQRYVCPPCGCAGDALVFDRPGKCSYCGMTLITMEQRDAPDKAQLPNGAGSVSFPFLFLANAIYLPVHVNGGGPYLFAMDTGSHTIVASELTGEMRLKNAANLELRLTSGVRRVINHIDTVPMYDLWPLVGQKIYGDVGYDFLRPYVVEIDYAKRRITLHDPARFRYAGSGAILPSTLWAQYDPQFPGELTVPGQAPIAVRFTIDTGAGGTIVSSPLVEKYDLINAVGKTLQVQDQRVGGYQPMLVTGRLGALRIGPYVLEKPVVALSRETDGSLSSPTISVNLGNNVLQRFAVFLDYPGNRVILEPNASLRDPFRYDASGLTLSAQGEDFRTFVVRAVAEGSPAKEAGVRAGDAVKAIDDAPASSYALWQLEDVLRKSQSTIKLSLDRGGTRIERTVALRELL